MMPFLRFNFLVSFLFVAGTLPNYAQEFNSTQYYSNLPNTNPGFTGIDDYLDVKFSVNQGWNSFNITNNNIYISAFSSLNSSARTSVKNNALRISTSAYGDILPTNQLRRKHGMGGTLAGRNIGPYRSVTLGYNYAYHIPLSSKFNFSLGSRLAYFNQRIDFSGFTVRETGDNLFDQLTRAGNANQSSFLMDFGAVLYSEKFYAALSSVNQIKGKISGDNLLDYSELVTYQFNTARNFRIAQTVQLNTGLRLTLKQGLDMGWAVNARFRYKELLYIGSGFNNNSQLSLLFGLAFNPNFGLHYTYDQYLSSLSSFNVNAHEIVLGIGLFNKAHSQPKFW
ncbi:MAG: PorP/SprF family type IX secretion system membrane protein [Cyclobacteriaceae bacterium]